MKLAAKGVIISVLITGLFAFLGPELSLKSAPSTSVKDTLSNSQLSYFARIGTATAGDNIFKIGTSSNPSNTTANLVVGDSLAIGTTNNGVGSSMYIVRDIGNTSTIELTTGLGTSNAWTGAYVVATNSAIHTVTFTPTSSVANGIWQVLIKATNRANETSNDGMPDQGGFDLGATTPSATGPAGVGMRLLAADVTCPFGTASVGTTVVLTTGVGLGSTGAYHVINCTLTAGATNPIGSAATITIGRAFASGAQLINPAPAAIHTEGTADVYTFYIRHAYSDGTLIDADTTAGKIAVIEGVRVAATVDPTITFYIDTPAAVSVGQTRCGNALTIGATNTSPTVVNFGPLALTAFNDVAQRFNITTNAKNGYAIQVYEDGPLTNLNTTATIPDTDCDTGNVCNTNTANTWVLDNGSTSSAFGYSLETGTTSVGTSIGIGSTNDQFKPFGVGNGNARTILQRASAPPITETAYICYRATASNTQEAGNYENSITFVATATF